MQRRQSHAVFRLHAEQSFKTAPSGERLFFPYGPWSRPYVLPDADTERRIYWKLVWQLRIMLGALILGMTILSLWRPPDSSPYFFVAIVAITAIFVLVSKVLFASDLQGLGRAPQRLPLRSFFGGLAGTHSFRALRLGLAVCLMFVFTRAWMVASGRSPVSGLLCVAFFGIHSISWGYAVWLKRPKPRA
jgi:hypothetical protein